MPSEVTPRRALIVAPITVTDAVLSQPLIALLRGLDPYGAIDVLASEQLAPLYHAIPAVDRVIPNPAPDDRLAPRSRLALARRLAANAYDCAYLLQPTPLAAIAPWLAGIPRRYGTTPAAFLGLVNRPYSTGASRGARGDRFASLALSPGQPLPPRLPPPQLEDIPPLTADRAKALGITADRPLIVFCPGSELGPASEWPARNYAELATLVAAEWPDATIALVGRRRDRELATRITLLSGQPLVNLAGRLRLAETLAVLGRATSVVTSESAFMHLAAALGRPSVAIYGAGDPRTERINGNRRAVMWLRPECGPCFDADCRFGHRNCIVQQPASAAFAALRRTMRFSATA